jgi:murein DD-endopeptidase MepM/ murein hydrolase activator NlpD
VIAVGEQRGYEGYGNVVQVAVGHGYTALYAHLAGWRVRVGDLVEAGQRLGTAGCTGSCSGTHLHFELRLRGQPVDPLRFRLVEGGAQVRELLLQGRRHLLDGRLADEAP